MNGSEVSPVNGSEVSPVNGPEVSYVFKEFEARRKGGPVGLP